MTKRRALSHPGPAADDGVPACVECGACCFSQSPEYLRVWSVDRARLGAHAAALTQARGDGCYVRLTDGHCAALAIDAAAERYECSVYEARPDVCRALERGSAACRDARLAYGARPLHAASRLVRAPR